ncbi:MAG: accessory factor UbiK family protein [Proteobacteria bacterium]|uniref:accessory factor UbiK family protein n=1 Tax=Rudaea sp. TaxID=2136325 RepID=UPI001E0410E4|nr:accessory factor UbiK family protein [Pseudomonadota bacterium]MBS0568275.1 accessory factor UbiK family protein [Pseudomonadota bacterium]
MIAVSPLDDLARRLVELVPPALADARARLADSPREAMDDLSANFKDTLRSGLRALDLVTREEFDVQRCVLLRTREMVEVLEHRVAELEALLGSKTAAH